MSRLVLGQVCHWPCCADIGGIPSSTNPAIPFVTECEPFSERFFVGPCGGLKQLDLAGAPKHHLAGDAAGLLQQPLSETGFLSSLLRGVVL